MGIIWGSFLAYFGKQGFLNGFIFAQWKWAVIGGLFWREKTLLLGFSKKKLSYK
jgi:hypothetical protein